jgi:hypothetical protein
MQTDMLQPSPSCVRTGTQWVSRIRITSSDIGREARDEQTGCIRRSNDTWSDGRPDCDDTLFLCPLFTVLFALLVLIACPVMSLPCLALRRL